MRDSYLILRLAADADDEAVEHAYREAIKRCPPERDAEQFAAIRSAYEQLCNARGRLGYELFDTTPPCVADLLDRAAPVDKPRRPDQSLLQALLRGDG